MANISSTPSWMEVIFVADGYLSRWAFKFMIVFLVAGPVLLYLNVGGVAEKSALVRIVVGKELNPSIKEENDRVVAGFSGKGWVYNKDAPNYGAVFSALSGATPGMQIAGAPLSGRGGLYIYELTVGQDRIVTYAQTSAYYRDATRYWWYTGMLLTAIAVWLIVGMVMTRRANA